MSNMKIEDATDFPRTAEVQDEARRLFGQLRFSANRGALVKGKYVTILVDPRWNSDATRVDVLVTCHELGLLTMDWQSLAIAPCSQDGKVTTLPIVLDGRGQAIMESLTPGRYSLAVYERTAHTEWESGLVFVDLPTGRYQLRLAEAESYPQSAPVGSPSESVQLSPELQTEVPPVRPKNLTRPTSSRIRKSLKERRRAWLWVPTLAAAAAVMLMFWPQDETGQRRSIGTSTGEEETMLPEGADTPPYQYIRQAAVLIQTETTKKPSDALPLVGVIVDTIGRVLTYADTTQGASEIDVIAPQLKSSENPQGAFTARHVKSDLRSNLALFELRNPPPSLVAIPLSETGQIADGDAVYTYYARPGMQRWFTDSSIEHEAKTGYEWTDRGQLHQSTVIQTTPIVRGVKDWRPWVPGFLVNKKGQLIGLNIHWDEDRWVNAAVTIEKIREFLK